MGGFTDWVGDRINDAGRAIHDAGAPVLGYDTYAQQEAQQRAEQATDAGQRERNILEQRNRALQDDVVGYDDPAISQNVNWSGYSHEEIYNTNQNSINEGEVARSGQAWVELGKALHGRGREFSRGLNNAISDGWTGDAAEAAKSLADPVQVWMERSGAAFEVTGNNLKKAGSAAGQVKQAVPEPEGHSWGRTAVATIATGPFGAGADALAQMNERKEAERAAQETMARVYSPTLADVDAQMPAFQAPQGHTVCPPPIPPPPPTEWRPPHIGDDRGTGDQNGGDDRQRGTDDRSSDGRDTTRDSDDAGRDGRDRDGSGRDRDGSGRDRDGTGDGSGRDRDGTGDGSGRDRTIPSGTTSQSTGQPGGSGIGVPGGVGAGLGAGGGGGVGGGMAGFGAGAVGGLGRGVGAGGLAAGGRAGVGGLGAGAGAGAGAVGAAARGAGAGRGMMGGMGGAGRRGQGGEDEEHERPSWLEEQDDVWLNDMPRTAPPVLGE
ncbi:hypothetical protein GCM10011581_05320 [Saccharopolyspora subtropica]|uniref:PPE domain-containing protein n=1 Tax=Saccharopolyspora thermophila TaxID=89367 RepID=A0A917N784_9PSEU|nr:PPE domain-containing protein [Saccharopolyspora subtropica]GGI71247.1 hypothetical protein GCM10011581_05320 [Saccharopolyspora subtropica]